MSRLTDDAYFRAAADLLEEAGGEALTIAALCERLGVTKGSFYHHFEAFPDFVGRLLAQWESEDSRSLPSKSRSDQPTERIAAFFDFIAAVPHATEAALRVWARQRADVAAARTRVDRRRERFLTDAITALDVDRADARTLARGALAIVIGTQLRDEAVDVKALAATLAQYSKLITLATDDRLDKRVKVIS